MVQILTCKHNPRQRTTLEGGHLLYESPADTLDGLDLRNLILRDADFQGQHLQGTDFSGSDLSGANFEGATLENVRFDGCDLSRTTFVEATLINVNFSDARFWGADLADCDLTRSCLLGARLEMSFHSKDTIWPAGISPEKRGVRQWNWTRKGPNDLW